MNQILEIKTKIQDLITQEVEKNNHQKERLNFLFSKLNEIKELETLQSLKEYENGKYLKAYLFYQSIKRANYQVEHLKLTKLDNTDKCLEMIEKDLEANQLKEKEPKFEPTNEQLLTLLGERLAGQYEDDEIKKAYYKDGEEDNFIKETWDRGFPYLGIWDKKTGVRIIRVCLTTGKIEPDPAEEFLKKHGIKNDNQRSK